MKKVEIFTDGSSLGNPGPGGWCALLRYNGIEKTIKGSKRFTTNNEMELKAVLEALKLLKEPVEVVIYTDSKYVANGINEWIENWAKKNWKNSKGKEVEHKEMWQEIYKLMKVHRVKAVWIKGHANHRENELCDKIAKQEANNIKTN